VGRVQPKHDETYTDGLESLGRSFLRDEGPAAEHDEEQSPEDRFEALVQGGFFLLFVIDHSRSLSGRRHNLLDGINH
jgi:hypothetical protein